MSVQDAIKRHVGDMISQQARTCFGTVTGVNPNNATVKLRLEQFEEEGGPQIITGWLPVQSAAIGNGWGFVWMPSVGDQAIAVPDSGSAENLIVTGFVYSTAQLPPAAPAGEMWMVHQTGTAIKMTNAGNLVLSAEVEISLTAAGHNVTISSAGVIIDGIVFGPHQHISESPGTPTSAPIAGT